MQNETGYESRFGQVAAECEFMLQLHSPELLRLADRSLTGRSDSRAQSKLRHELEEFEQAVANHDRIGAYAELADLVYYSVKAVDNHLMSPREVAEILASACLVLDCIPAAAFMASKVKYRLRAEINQAKDDANEREAIAEYLGQSPISGPAEDY